MKLLLKNFRIVDSSGDITGSVVTENGIITEVIPSGKSINSDSAVVIDGERFTSESKPVLMPAFTDLHAHFRDPGYTDKENLESATLAAVAGGYGTAVCMANTKPVIDSADISLSLKERSDTLCMIDLYTVLSVTKNMEGKVLSEINTLPEKPKSVMMISEDGKDVVSEELLLSAFREARRLGIPVSCHCDFGGEEAEKSKRAGDSRAVWSRIEENYATERVISLWQKERCHIHIAHVSTKESVEIIREAKRNNKTEFLLTCEATPHHLALSEACFDSSDAESFSRVNPPLRACEDRDAVLEAVLDGTIDAVATDHAPHTKADKIAGAPGFSGIETSFSVCFTHLVKNKNLSLSRLSWLMSDSPARILSLHDRGRIACGLHADLVIVDTEKVRKINPDSFKSKGKNSPFKNQSLSGEILMTIHKGRVVYMKEV